MIVVRTNIISTIFRDKTAVARKTVPELHSAKNQNNHVKERRGGVISHGEDDGGEAEDGDQEDEDEQRAAGVVQVCLSFFMKKLKKKICFRDTFVIFDKDGDGTIDSKELSTVLKSMGYNPTKEEIQEMVDEVLIENINQA